MADNTTLNTGSGGDVIACDDISGVKFPRSKIVLGADGVNDGDVSSANPLPVSVSGTVTVGAHNVTNAGTFATQAAQSGTWTVQPGNTANTTAWLVTGTGGTFPITAASLPLPTGAATAANQATANTSLSSIDTSAGRLAGKYLDFDSGAGTDSAVAVGLLLPASGGAVIGGTSSNPIRTDPTGTTTQPVSAASLPLPSNAAQETGGNLAAVAASLNVMDDWDESDRAKVNLIVGQAGISAGAGAVGASTPRVTLASDDPGVTSLAVIDDWDESDRCKVNLVAGQSGITAGAGAVGASTPRVTLASDDPAVAKLTDIETNTDSGAVVGNGAAATAQRVTLANDSTGVLATVSTVATLTGSGIAHDAADSGNPHKIGAKAKSALSGLTLVAADDRTDCFADLDGALVMREDCPNGDLVNGNASNTDGTSTACITAQGAGVKTVLTDITLTNTSSSMTYVEIKDGSAVKWTFPVPANGGVVFSWKKPLVGTTNTAWNFDPGAATSTIYCSMSGYKSKV